MACHVAAIIRLYAVSRVSVCLISNHWGQDIICKEQRVASKPLPIRDFPIIYALSNSQICRVTYVIRWYHGKRKSRPKRCYASSRNIRVLVRTTAVCAHSNWKAPTEYTSWQHRCWDDHVGVDLLWFCHWTTLVRPDRNDSLPAKLFEEVQV